MAIKNTQLGGTDVTDPYNWKYEDLNDTFDALVERGKTNGVTVQSTLGAFPAGTIIPWMKSLSGTPSIPAGWVECDGTSSTPDLQGTSDTDKRFLRGTNGSTGGTGGTATHTHSIYRSGTQEDDDVDAGREVSVSTESHIPPSYEVVFIIKT